MYLQKTKSLFCHISVTWPCKAQTTLAMFVYALECLGLNIPVCVCHCVSKNKKLSDFVCGRRIVYVCACECMCERSVCVCSSVDVLPKIRFSDTVNYKRVNKTCYIYVCMLHLYVCVRVLTACVCMYECVSGQNHLQKQENLKSKGKDFSHVCLCALFVFMRGS